MSNEFNPLYLILGTIFKDNKDYLPLTSYQLAEFSGAIGLSGYLPKDFNQALEALFCLEKTGAISITTNEKDQYLLRNNYYGN